MWSIPSYLSEVRRLRSVRDVRDWTYYKFPRAFALRDFPTAITLEITNECNFGCPHCPRSFLNAKRDVGFMDLPVIEKIASESEGRVAEIKIIGVGEGSLHPDLGAIMAAFRRHGIRARLYTNGTVFERYSPAEICAWGLSVLVVSIDGTDQASFERLRVGGDYRATRANLTAFRAFRDAPGHRGPAIEIRHVIMPSETPDQLAAFKTDWLALGGDTVKFNLLGPKMGVQRREDPERPGCRDIRRELHIRWDGRVPLCGYGEDREWLGDVRRFRLEEIWNAPRLREVRSAHDRHDLSGLDACKTCQHR